MTNTPTSHRAYRTLTALPCDPSSGRRSARAGRAGRAGLAGRGAVFLVLILLASACAERTAAKRTTSVEVLSPVNAPLLVGPNGGQSRQLTARVLDQSGGELTGRTVTWGVTTPSTLSVTASGVVTALAAGPGVVTATVDGMVGSIQQIVQDVPIATLAITEDTLRLEVSAIGASSIALTLNIADSTGAALPGRPVAFTSAAPSIATVAVDGTVTAVSVGTTIIRALAEVHRDSAVVVVTAVDGFPTGFDIAIVDVQWTQGAQDAGGRIPMVRNGRAAVVNVMTRASAAVLDANAFVLRVTDLAGGVVHTETKSLPIPAGTSSAANPTLQFLVPASVLQPGIRWQVERDPLGELPDADAATDVFPSAPQALTLYTPPLLRLRFVPVALAAHGNVAPVISEALLEQYLVTIRKIIPHGEIEASIGPSFVTGVSFGSPPQGGGPGFWTSLLAALDQQRVANPANADAHWIGVVRPPAGFSFVTNGGWAYIPSTSEYLGPGSRTFTMVDYNWATAKDWVQNLAAHELGHNLGRFHAPSCGAPGADGAFPEPDGRIGAGAHDTYAWELGLTPSAAGVPSTRYDVMGYCSPVWVSPYTYDAMVQFRGDVGTALVAPRPPERVLFVRGHVEGQAARIDTALVMNAIATPSDATGAWTLEGRAADGRVLFTHRFALARYDHSETLRPFGVTLALTAPAAADLVSIHLTGPGARAERRLR